MNVERPTLYATLVKPSPREVRHLLLESVDGYSVVNLVQLSAGIANQIATGTHYEVSQQADALVQQWVEGEGFERRATDKPAYEPLAATVALALRLGHEIVYDNRFKKLDRPPLNATGTVRLSDWPGMTPKNGGGYEYALLPTSIHARPTLPPTGKPLVVPTGGQELAAFLLEVKALQDTVGPSAEFLLAGRLF